MPTAPRRSSQPGNPQPGKAQPGRSPRPATRQVGGDSLLSPEDKKALIADARARDRVAKLTAKERAENTSEARSERERLQAEIVDLKSRLTAIKGIAVGMHGRSARISQVPGHVLAEYSNQLLREINRK